VKNAPLVWIVLSVLCSSIAHFSLKLGALRLNVDSESSNTLLPFGANWWLILGGALHVLALALWVVGLRYVALSVAYPFIALGFVLVSLLSWMFLSEAVTGLRLAGMLLIASGVVLIART
jgi:drug/metabolite transporter (DMT)-like permease